MNTHTNATHTPTPWNLARILPREDAATGVLNICAGETPLFAICDRNARAALSAAKKGQQ